MDTLKNEINLARLNNKKYGVIRNWHQPTPSIDDFKNLEKNKAVLGRISLRAFNGKDESISSNPEIHFFLNESIKVHPDQDYQFYMLSTPVFRNISPDRPGTGLHKDPFPIIHWQCRGVTLWRIGLNAKNNSFTVTESGGHLWDSEWLEEPDTFLLEPGDIIWFDDGVWHETENLTEKYSIVFDAGVMQDESIK